MRSWCLGPRLFSLPKKRHDGEFRNAARSTDQFPPHLLPFSSATVVGSLMKCWSKAAQGVNSWGQWVNGDRRSARLGDSLVTQSTLRGSYAYESASECLGIECLAGLMVAVRKSSGGEACPGSRGFLVQANPKRRRGRSFTMDGFRQEGFAYPRFKYPCGRWDPCLEQFSVGVGGVSLATPHHLEVSKILLVTYDHS